MSWRLAGEKERQIPARNRTRLRKILECKWWIIEVFESGKTECGKEERKDRLAQGQT